MKRADMLLVLFASAVAMAITACGSGDNDAAPLRAALGNDNRVEIADREAKKLDERARIVWAGGRLLSGETMGSPADADTWDFNAIALDENGIAGMWELTLLVEQWTTKPLEFPPMEIEYIDLTAISMDVDEAWTILEQQGLARPFFTWELFKPLKPGITNPCYAFYVGGGQYLFVDIITGAAWSGASGAAD